MCGIRVWFKALRPKTLPASIIPVTIGSALAAIDGKFIWTAFTGILICAVLMQIASNFINEIYDFRRGADDANRIGPTRSVAAGLIPEKKMKRAAIATIAIAFTIGLYLTSIGGWHIFILGVVSLIGAWAYTGGKYPLAYMGFGEALAFVFYGIIAVCGTYYILTGEVKPIILIASLAPAAFAANILAVNNIRDIETDRLAGKMTISVRMGAKFSRVLYGICAAIPFVVTVVMVVDGYSKFALLAFISMPPAIFLTVELFRRDGAALNSILTGTGVLLVFYAILLIAGLLTY